MKRYCVLGFIAVYLLLTAGAASSQDDIKKHPACKSCGMDREKFAHSRMFIEYDDGATEGTCSIHCAAILMTQNKDRRVKSLMVADYKTKRLIDSRAATWVIGGVKTGIMTSTPIWAFASEEDARGFIMENGGRLTLFDPAMAATNKEVVENKEITHDHHGHAGHDMEP